MLALCLQKLPVQSPGFPNIPPDNSYQRETEDNTQPAKDRIGCNKTFGSLYGCVNASLHSLDRDAQLRKSANQNQQDRNDDDEHRHLLDVMVKESLKLLESKK